MIERYLTQLTFNKIFPKGQEIINKTSVAIVGVGGTGSHIAELMARMGFGIIIIVDDDSIELSNLNRQTLYDEEDIGKPKALVAAEKLRRINTDIKIIAHKERVDSSNIDRILGPAQLIMDGTDSYESRAILNRYAVNTHKIFIFSAVEGSLGMGKMIVPHLTSCLSCFGYPSVGGPIPCSVNGLLPTAVEMAASISVTLALRALLGEFEDYLYIFNVWDSSIDRIKTELNPKCPVCGINK